MSQHILRYRYAKRVPSQQRRLLKHRWLAFLTLVVSIILFTAWLNQSVQATEATWSSSPYSGSGLNQTPTVVQLGTSTQEMPQEPIPAPSDPCSLEDVVCPSEIIITHYQAVESQTDATPCIGAMPGVDFCHPPFPIVANNCLKLGSKVVLEGKTYTVADRLNKRFGCNYYDILVP